MDKKYTTTYFKHETQKRRELMFMEIDEEKIDDAVLALLYLTLHDGSRVWKSMDWEVMDRLHKKGLISNPVGKAKSVLFTEEGQQKSEELYEN